MALLHGSGETMTGDALRRFGWGDIALWSMSILFVLAAQAGMAHYILARTEPAEAPGAPPPAIFVEFADVATAPQIEDLALDEGELSLSPDPTIASDASEPDEVPQETPPVPDPSSLAEPLQPDQALEEPPVPAEPEQQALDELAEESEPIPDIVPVEAPAIAIPMPVSVPASIVEQRRQFAEQKRQEQARREQQQAAQQQVASQQSAPHSVQAQQSQQVAAPQQTDTTQRTPTISPQQWQGQIRSMIDRAKHYPQDAQRGREQGTIHVQFVISRSGAVLSARIVRSSGFASLDGAGVDLINRLPTLPAPPVSIPGDPVSLVVPVNFSLR